MRRQRSASDRERRSPREPKCTPRRRVETSSSVQLELKSCGELDLARSSKRCTGNPAKVAARQRQVRIPEVGPVERVVKLDAGLEGNTVAHVKRLRDGEIPFVDAGAAQIGQTRWKCS